MRKNTDKIEADKLMLAEARRRGPLATLGAFVKLSGPGWLQSAMTLGGGSLAGSLYLGVLAGFGMMWLQPVAMMLGIVMLSAIGYVTMSTGERPFRAINQHVNPVLGWGWALASLTANMVWCLPQFSLATGVLQQNLLPTLVGDDSLLCSPDGRLPIVAAILLITVGITWAYDSGNWGIRLYEWVLKLIVAMIVVCFVGVVIRLSTSTEGLPWREIGSGFIPDLTKLYRPASAFSPLLAELPEAIRGYWDALIVGKQRDVMIGAAATAVGINMTFLLPYSMLARGWRKEFRGLAVFDLSTGMLIPFMLATSCVVIAASTQFHAKVPPGLLGETEVDGQPAASASPRLVDEMNALLKSRLRATLGSEQAAGLTEEQWQEELAHVTPPERRLAATLVTRDAADLAQSLAPLTGTWIANVVFGLGVLGMTLSTITLLMLISGFVICEIFNLPLGGWPHRLGCLAAAVGACGPFLPGRAFMYLAVPASVFGMMLLPIAYWTFFLLMNQPGLLGDEIPRGARRWAWNVLMIVAATTATFASAVSIYSRVTSGELLGKLVLVAAVSFVILAVAVQIKRMAAAPAGGGGSSGSHG